MIILNVLNKVNYLFVYTDFFYHHVLILINTAPNIVIEKPSQDADQRVEFPEKETPERYIVYTNDNTFRSKNEISSKKENKYNRG